MARVKSPWYWFLGICLVVCFSHGQRSCPDDFLDLSLYCVKIGDPSNWQTYIDDCFNVGGNVNTEELLYNYFGMKLVDELLDQNITSIWHDARWHAPFGPFKHQLPDNDMYFKTSSELDKLFFITRNFDLQCVILTFNTVSRNVEFTAKHCDENLYNYVCIFEKGRNTYLPTNISGSQSRRPVLQLISRYTEKLQTISLEVTYPKNLWRWDEVQPVCVMDGADVTIDGAINISRYFDRTTQANYYVKPTGDGYISCSAYVAGDRGKPKRIYSDQFLYRTVEYVYTIYGRMDYEDATKNYNNSYLDIIKVKKHQLEALLKFANFSGFSPVVTPLGFAKANWNPDGLNPSVWSVFRVSLEPKFKLKTLLNANTDGMFLRQIEDTFDPRKIKKKKSAIGIWKTFSSSFCLAKSQNGSNELSWSGTRPGEVASLSSSVDCVGDDCGCANTGPRRCEGNFTHGVSWEKVTTPMCNLFMTRVQTLQNLSMDATDAGLHTPSTDNTLVRVVAAIRDEEPLSVEEVGLIAGILASNNLDNRLLQQADITPLATIINKLSEGNGSRLAQRATHSSQTILESVDRLLNDVILTNASSLTVTPRYFTLVADVASTPGGEENNDLRGMLFRKGTKEEGDSFKKENIDHLLSDYTVDRVLQRDMEAAVLLPPQLYINTSDSVRLVLQAHRDEALFYAEHPGGTIGHVLSVSLDGETDLNNLDPPVYLFFNNYGRQNRKATCVFWDLTANNWSDVGCTLDKSHPNSNIDVCVCTHLTHFALLVYEEEVPNKALDIISAVGCSLSLIGLALIGVTGVIFKEWRKTPGHKIQLHLSAAIALLMSLFLVDSLVPIHERPQDELLCKVRGVLLHYAVLASFSWMLVVAVLQYLRLVVVWATFSRVPYLVTKAALFGWGIPLLPCAFLLGFKSDLYGLPRCYLQGDAQLFGVYVPVSSFVFTNCLIFGVIMYKITCSKNIQTNQDSRRVAIQRLVTSCFLFILFGLDWVFALVKLPVPFCIFASLQGVSLFLFFIILDPSTYQKWRLLLTNKKNVNTYTNSDATSRKISKASIDSQPSSTPTAVMTTRLVGGYD